ncbi:hypothetical protein C8R46DRAFT_1242390 [Mycena filopes]|nr:hypothetical protein C8R46DRAFT_1242390 [Mycena filopes]
MNSRRSGPGAHRSGAHRSGSHRNLSPPFPAQDRSNISIPSKVSTNLPANFTELSIYDQLFCAFPHFRVENIRTEMQGKDTTILEKMMLDLKHLPASSISSIGIPPRHGEVHDIFYTPIPRSHLSIRFYPGGNMAATEQVYCMDVYDPNQGAPVAIPSDWAFFKILAPDDVNRVFGPDEDFFDPSGSAVPHPDVVERGYRGCNTPLFLSLHVPSVHSNGTPRSWRLLPLCTTSQHVLKSYIFKSDAALDAASSAAATAKEGDVATAPAAAPLLNKGKAVSEDRELVHPSSTSPPPFPASRPATTKRPHTPSSASGAKDFGDWITRLIAPSNITVYYVLCAFATFKRSALKT